MNCTVMAVGKLREKPFRDMADEYYKRLSRYGKFSEVELSDLPEPPNSSPALEEQIKQREGESILARIKPTDYVIALTITGKQYASPDFAQHLQSLSVRGVGNVVLVIGGSLGLSDRVVKRANEQLSMSPMTFPHQLARVMLLEQLYRAMKISAGERYHK